MVKILLSLIPPHTLYCEPFFGGGALFFAKPKSETEVINDKNGEVINFYKVVQTKFPALEKEIRSTLHSRELFKNARVVYEHPDMFSDVKRGWAFWTLTNQGFAGMVTSWGFGKDNSKEVSLARKRKNFSKEYAKRLQAGSRVQDAQNAVFSTNGGVFHIENSTLDRNYQHVVVQTSTSALTPATIQGSNFTCSGLLISPHSGIRTIRGFEITDVNAITIGITGASNKNLFDNMDIGIHSTNSNVNVINDLFNNIQQTSIVAIPICCALGTCSGSQCNPPPVGFAIHATGNPTGNPNRTLTVGGIVATQKCTIQVCSNAIFAQQNINVDVQNNILTNINSSSIIPSNSIRVTTTNGKTVLIKGNKLTNVRNGIFFSSSNNTTATISNNTITNFGASTFGGNAIQTLQTNNCTIDIGFNAINGGNANKQTGIRMQNAIISPGSTYVHNNNIKNIQNGIWGTNIPSANIGSLNKIYYLPSIPSFISYGIHLENTTGATINQNLVQRNGNNNPTPSYTTQLFGISADISPTSQITNNQIDRTGTGIRCFGNHLPSSTVQCNILNLNQRGVTLENTDIGNQGTTSSASDNQWNVFAGRDADVKGIFNTQRTWYVQSSSLPYKPQIISPFNTILIPPPVPSTNACSNPCFLPPQLCNYQLLGQIAKNTPPLNQASFEMQFMAKQTALSEIRKDTILLHLLGTPEDTVLQNFHDSMMNTNMGKIQKTREFISRNDFSNAAIVNNSISADNLIEQNHKTVHDVFLRSWANDIDAFSPADSAALQNIALQNPLSGGIGVYDARVMLGIDVNDFAPLSARFSEEVEMPVTIDNVGIMYPNPTSDGAVYETELEENETGALEIYDVIGNKISSYVLVPGENKVSVSTTDIYSGIYLYKIIINGQLEVTNKLAVTK